MNIVAQPLSLFFTRLHVNVIGRKARSIATLMERFCAVRNGRTISLTGSVVGKAEPPVRSPLGVDIQQQHSWFTTHRNVPSYACRPVLTPQGREQVAKRHDF